MKPLPRGSTLWLSIAFGCAAIARGQEEPPAIPREFRGVWVATVENIDWPSKRDLTADRQRQELAQIMDLAVSLRLNAVIFQVRPACDALYRSDLEPWSPYLNGRMGQGPEPFYDPLQLAVELAHARGLELHAWFNPYRARTASYRGELDSSHVSKAHPHWVREYGGMLWLDPGDPDALAHTLAVIEDVVQRYDIDGVHLDDYFYPYPVQGKDGSEVPFPDDSTYANRPLAQRALTRDDWRRANVDQLVKTLYRRVKSRKAWVKVGISPFGIWRPGHPESVQGFDAYDKLYADARKWLHRGWLDYATPQLYWTIDAPAQSYSQLLKWWHQENAHHRHLWPGNFTSRVGDASRPWAAEEILRQIEATRAEPGASGNVHFSMKSFIRNSEELCDKLRAGPYAQQALIPASTWLDESAETSADHSIQGDIHLQVKGAVVRWTCDDNDPPWLWAIQYRVKEQWRHAILPGHAREIQLSPQDPPPERVRLWTVDRTNSLETVRSEPPASVELNLR